MLTLCRPFALGLALSATLPLACELPGAAEECFVDPQCPAGLSCIDGVCQEPTDESGGDEEDDDFGEKLDVGGGTVDATTCEGASFVATNSGCEFWAVDLPNAWAPSTPYSLDIATEQTFAVVVANVSESDNARVSVYEGDDDDPIATAVVGPLGTYVFELPNDHQLDPTRNDGGMAFRVESDRPVTAYQFQPLDNLRPVYSNDATSLLPAHVLQDDYIAVTSNGTRTTMYPSGWTEQSLSTGAFVTVVADEDDTHVEFYPTDVLVEGAWEGVVLQRGQAFTILADAASEVSEGGSLSGTRVVSDRPIAVFSGNVTAGEPRNATECCLDHVEHQLLPAVAWGATYVAAPPPDPNDEDDDDPMVVRLTGAHPGTQLRYPAGKPDGAPDTLDLGQTVELTTSEGFIVEAEDPTTPFAVTQYLLNGGEANPGSDVGDPAMIFTPSVEQLMERYVFLAPIGYRTSVVTIVAPTDAEVELDGEEIGGGTTIGDAAGREWGYRRAEIEPGAHVVSADSPVQITVVGYDVNVSYAYAGGSAVEVINDAPPAP